MLMISGLDCSSFLEMSHLDLGKPIQAVADLGLKPDRTAERLGVTVRHRTRPGVRHHGRDDVFQIRTSAHAPGRRVMHRA
ncbi:hypothetical protein BDI4_190021 [Burkholderia diffusa]|nr:hypothetical protein BDI4_190021 [Burkholderia diffusa]